MASTWKVLSVLMAAAAPAWGQITNIPPGSEKVDPGVGDVGSLGGVSRVNLRKDLRQERGFGSVYKLELPTPMGGPGATSSLFFRVDGGVTAVFPESVYESARTGPVPTVPPGTKFYIGQLPTSVVGAPPRGPLPTNYVDMSASLRSDAAPGQGVVIPRRYGADRTIWEDEEVRHRTIGDLLDEAAAAGGAG